MTLYKFSSKTNRIFHVAVTNEHGEEVTLLNPERHQMLMYLRNELKDDELSEIAESNRPNSLNQHCLQFALLGIFRNPTEFFTWDF